jgi:glycosyltransferase involved in cell wall biosynthesis
VSPIRVGYLGRFDGIKGILDLGRAVASLPRTTPLRVEFRGPVVNDAEHGIKRQLAAMLGDDSRVEFAPPVPSAQAPEVLSGYDVLCCPPVCLEGGPTVAIEAHAVGTPVIGTQIGGLAELITDGIDGRLVKPGDWRALAGVLEEIAHDPPRTIDRWRGVLPPARNLDEIARDYLTLYQA